MYYYEIYFSIWYIMNKITIYIYIYIYIYMLPHGGWAKELPAAASVMQSSSKELSTIATMWTQDVTLKTCRRRWMIGRSDERGSGISVLAAWHDDDDGGSR